MEQGMVTATLNAPYMKRQAHGISIRTEYAGKMGVREPSKKRMHPVVGPSLTQTGVKKIKCGHDKKKRSFVSPGIFATSHAAQKEQAEHCRTLAKKCVWPNIRGLMHD